MRLTLIDDIRFECVISFIFKKTWLWVLFYVWLIIISLHPSYDCYYVLACTTEEEELMGLKINFQMGKIILQKRMDELSKRDHKKEVEMS